MPGALKFSIGGNEFSKEFAGPDAKIETGMRAAAAAIGYPDDAGGDPVADVGSWFVAALAGYVRDAARSVLVESAVEDARRAEQIKPTPFD